MVTNSEAKKDADSFKNAVITGIVALVLSGMGFLITTTVTNKSEVAGIGKEQARMTTSLDKFDSKLDTILAHTNDNDKDITEVKAEVNILSKQVDALEKKAEK